MEHPDREKEIFTIKELTEEKERLLKEYKSYEEKLEEHADDFDRERVAIRIKALGKEIRRKEAEV